MSYERPAADDSGLLLRDRQSESPSGIRHESVSEHGRRTTALAKLAKAFILALVVTAGMSAGPRSAAAEEAPAQFIYNLGNQVLAVIRSDATLAGKVAYFHQMVRQDFDLTSISRFVLGPYWRVASPAEREEFCSLFEDHLINIYGRQLARYGSGGFIVTGSRSEPDGVIVTSRIITPQGASLEVDWRLAVSDGVYKIDDLTIDGVSMSLAQRSEFVGVIERDGGQVGTLLAAMREES